MPTTKRVPGVLRRKAGSSDFVGRALLRDLGRRQVPGAVLALEPRGLPAQDDRGQREADQPLQGRDEHREDARWR